MRRSILTIDQILKWADAFHARYRRWPRERDGIIDGTLGAEKWGNVNQMLRLGGRGLPKGLSLVRLLAIHRGVRNRKGLPPYTLAQILSWADRHHERTGRWPKSNSGPIKEAPGETWLAVDMALRNGIRGLPGGSSLARLLARKRTVRNVAYLPKLSIARVLDWIDSHRRRTGRWPTGSSGTVLDAPEETWSAIDKALRHGRRGLPGSSSLARLLAKHRGVRRHVHKPPLSLKQILAWADAHFDRTGRWPREQSGPIPEAPGETWQTVQNALREARRGFDRPTSVARILAKHRGVRNIQNLPPLSEDQIVQWALEHFERTGRWPTRNSGVIPGSGGTTWQGVRIALRVGNRRLPGGKTLSKLLATQKARHGPQTSASRRRPRRSSRVPA